MSKKNKKKKTTSKSSETLTKYLREINSEDTLTEEEEIELAKRIKNGDKAAVEKLIKCNLRFVISIAKQYNGRGLSIDDLVNEGNLGLIKGVYKYDETRGIKFISYAVWWIRQSISQALSECSRVVRLPLNKVNNLNRFVVARNKLQQKNRREPTIYELSQELKMNIDEVMSVIDTYKFPLYADSAPKDDDSYSFVDILADENDNLMTEKKDLDSFNEEINSILSKLDKVEEDVIRYYFGFPPCKMMTLDEIGSILNLTRERVRQIKEKAISNIKKFDECDKLREYIDKTFTRGN